MKIYIRLFQRIGRKGRRMREQITEMSPYLPTGAQTANTLCGLADISFSVFTSFTYIV